MQHPRRGGKGCVWGSRLRGDRWDLQDLNQGREIPVTWTKEHRGDPRSYRRHKREVCGNRYIASAGQRWRRTHTQAGGIKSTNAVRTLFGSITASGKSLDGLAVVSDIVASREPLIAAKKLKDAVTLFKASRIKFSSVDEYTTESLRRSVGEALRSVRELSPLVHQVRPKHLNSNTP